MAILSWNLASLVDPITTQIYVSPLIIAAETMQAPAKPLTPVCLLINLGLASYKPLFIKRVILYCCILRLSFFLVQFQVDVLI